VAGNKQSSTDGAERQDLVLPRPRRRMSAAGDRHMRASEAIALAEISEARARLASTLATLEGRLAPSRLEKDVAAGLKASAGRGARGICRKARAHPGLFAACGAIAVLAVTRLVTGRGRSR
jgi:hypothetical protein